MDAKTFFSRIESYYGQHYRPGELRSAVIAYLKGCSPVYLDALYPEVLKQHSGTWGKLPDIGIFESSAVRVPAEQRTARVIAERRRIADNRNLIGEDECVDPETVKQFLAEFREKMRQKNLEALKGETE